MKTRRLMALAVAALILALCSCVKVESDPTLAYKRGRFQSSDPAFNLYITEITDTQTGKKYLLCDKCVLLPEVETKPN